MICVYNKWVLRWINIINYYYLLFMLTDSLLTMPLLILLGRVRNRNL